MSEIISLLQQSIYWIVVLGVFLIISMVRGKQFLINSILGLYFALLISLEFPYYDKILSGVEADQFSDSVTMVVIFLVFTVIAIYLFNTLMPHDEGEPAFEGFGKKFLFAILASILVMAYTYNALPVTDIITPGSPIQALFAPEQNFFWWLLFPLTGILFL